MLTKLALFCILAVSLKADILTFSGSDPVGDNTGSIDLTGWFVTVDTSNGHYSTTVTADPAHPFSGASFLVSLFMFNPSRDATLAYSVGFLSSGGPDTILTRTGINTNFELWKAGDQVAYDSGPFGNPPGALLFRSGVIELLPSALASDFFGALPGGDVSASDFVTLQSVPEPSSFVLLGLGLTGLLFATRGAVRAR